MTHEIPSQLQRQADRIVADHAAEISMPLTPISAPLEATKIEIGTPPDPWDIETHLANGSQTMTTHGLEGRRKNRAGEFSKLFDRSMTPFKKEDQLPEKKVKGCLTGLKEIYVRSGIKENDPAIKKNLERVKTAHSAGLIGKRFGAFVGSVVNSLQR